MQHWTLAANFKHLGVSTGPDPSRGQRENDVFHLVTMVRANRDTSDPYKHVDLLLGSKAPGLNFKGAREKTRWWRSPPVRVLVAP